MVASLEFARNFSLGFAEVVAISVLFSSKDEPIDVQRIPSTRLLSKKVDECTSFANSGTLTEYRPRYSGDCADKVYNVRNNCILTTSSAFGLSSLPISTPSDLVEVNNDNISRNNPESEISLALEPDKVVLRLPPPSNNG